MVRWRLAILLILALKLSAETPIFPLKDIRPGQKGIGKTVFSGNRIEEFQVEVLGVLENLGPKQSIILARLSGGPLAKTGVMQGMSGSPVYIDGKLAGAVALGFSYATEPIAGIRPIEDMLPLGVELVPRDGIPSAVRKGPSAQPSLASLASNFEVLPKSSGLVEIATPLSFSGFTAATLNQFAPELRKLGLEPRQGVSSGGHLPPQMGDPSSLHPGDMITVQLLSGDYSIGADGTVTEIQGKRVYAFGHHFLSVGETELPFAKANVITVLPDLAASFKISSAKEWMGAITQDRNTSIYGELGKRAFTLPLSITVKGGRHSPFTYNMRMVNDRVLSPFILQMAVYSSLDVTERTLGSASYILRGQVSFEGNVPPLKLDNTYAGDYNVPMQASTGVASPLAYVMQSGFEALKIRSIDLTLDASEKKRLLQIEQVTASKREVRPGENLDLYVVLASDNGAEEERKLTYAVPAGASVGPLSITVADATATNMLEYQQLLSSMPKNAAQVVDTLNHLRPNTSAYVRIWRSDPDFQVEGADLPDPPASVALVLAKAQAGQGTPSLARGSTLAEFQLDTPGAVITGSKTIRVDVKE